MSGLDVDTQSLNKHRHDLTSLDEIWVFGYGSLIYKVDFEYIESRFAYIHNYVRRFWQGSQDHRGTPEQPGRVLTLMPEKGARCFGRAFKVNHDVFDHLDHREKNGYLRDQMPFHFKGGGQQQGLVYIANPDNPAFLGEASIDVIARHIASSSGPSGENSDYVFELANALREHNEFDEHVFGIEKAIKSLV